MIRRDDVVEILYLAIDEINTQQPGDARLSKTEQTVLFGPGAALDSLSLVNLVVEAETNLTSKLDLSIPLAETIMSGDVTPPRTLGELADFVVMLGSGASSA